MLRIPWWLPALVIGAARLLWPRHSWVAVLAYHLVCLMGLRGPFKWGQVGRAWIPILVAFALLPLILLIPPLQLFPRDQAADLLSHWPGGLVTWAIYSFVFNVAIEEAFWRGTLVREKPWPAYIHGAAFGLHHGVAGLLQFGWMWALPSFLLPAIIGTLWAHSMRRSGGLGVVLLTHLWADAALVLLVAGQLR